MGCLLSCCPGNRSTDSNESSTPSRGVTPDTNASTTELSPVKATATQRKSALTEQDRKARSAAGVAAGQRQQKFEASPLGRAAYKSEKEVKAPTTPLASRRDNQDNAKDWLS